MLPVRTALLGSCQRFANRGGPLPARGPGRRARWSVQRVLTVRGNEFKAEFAATCVKLQVIGSRPHAGHDLAWLTDRTVVVGTGDSECVKHIVENTASFVSIR